MRIITSMMKMSLEVPFFQWSQLKDHSEWRPVVEAWWGKFKVST